jgi:hypothetical protein
MGQRSQVRMAAKGESVLATQARLELEQIDRVVLAEGALRRELIVSWVRVVAIVGFASASLLIDTQRTANVDWLRIAVGTTYLVWAVQAVIGVRRGITLQKSSRWLRSVTAWSVATPVLDTAFNLTLICAPTVLGDLSTLPAMHPERSAVTFALLIVFAVARKGWEHVAWSVALSLSPTPSRSTRRTSPTARGRGR